MGKMKGGRDRSRSLFVGHETRGIRKWRLVDWKCKGSFEEDDDGFVKTKTVAYYLVLRFRFHFHGRVRVSQQTLLRHFRVQNFESFFLVFLGANAKVFRLPNSVFALNQRIPWLGFATLPLPLQKIPQQNNNNNIYIFFHSSLYIFFNHKEIIKKHLYEKKKNHITTCNHISLSLKLSVSRSLALS